MSLTVLVVLTLAVAVFATVVNARHDRRAEEAAASPDARVDAAWESYGGDEDARAPRQALDALLAEAPIDALKQKTSLVRVAVMAARAHHMEALSAVAARLPEIAGGCAETQTVVALSEAYGGDPSRARQLLFQASCSLGACAGCGSTLEAKLLLQEAAVAAEALESDPDAGTALAAPSTVHVG